MLNVRAQQLGGISILCLQGRVGIAEKDTLRFAVQSQSSVDTLVLNFGQVVGIDAAGLGMLLELREWARAKGTEFKLLNVTKRVREVLEITCLSSVFKNSSEADVLALAPQDRPYLRMQIARCA